MNVGSIIINDLVDSTCTEHIAVVESQYINETPGCKMLGAQI